MAKTGPKRKPLALRLTEQNFRDRRPEPPVVMPAAPADPPPDLKGDALALWNVVAPAMSNVGLLTPERREVLAHACRTHAELRRTERALRRTSISDRQYHRLVASMSSLGVRLDRLMDRCGLDYRTVSTMATRPAQQSDEERFFGASARVN